jgi:hypothetical protein
MGSESVNPGKPLAIGENEMCQQIVDISSK